MFATMSMAIDNKRMEVDEDNTKTHHLSYIPCVSRFNCTGRWLGGNETPVVRIFHVAFTSYRANIKRNKQQHREELTRIVNSALGRNYI